MTCLILEISPHNHFQSLIWNMNTFISKEEFLLQTNQICDSLEKIKGFVCFAVQNIPNIIERQFMEMWNILLRFCQNF